MDGMQVLLVVVVVEALMIIALLLVVYGQGKQLGGAYPADIKQILGAMAGLAVFFAAKSPSSVDDTVVNGALMPLFKILGIDVPVVGGTLPIAAPASTATVKVDLPTTTGTPSA